MKFFSATHCLPLALPAKVISALPLYCWCWALIPLRAQEIFPAPAPAQKRQIAAVRTAEPIRIDGKLNEPSWRQCPAAEGFMQSEPRQGEKASFDTRVSILFDDRYVYFGAFCHDPEGRRGVFVQDLRRDFSYAQNELFSVSLDPFRDVRMPIPTFQVTPYGTQRDLLIYDDRVYDTDWDAVWQTQTTLSDSGYVVEMAIPWSSLRYPAHAGTWGINFNRNIRRLNEVTGWSPWPRAYTVGRMAYAGLVTGLEAPLPSLNLRVQPYTLVTGAHQGKAGSAETAAVRVQAGGEIKWAITPNTVGEVTVNTDFAQADVDRQVVNLSRSSVFLPERRQFFLEGANLFAPGEDGLIQPFFSRRIGLDSAGLTIPLDAGARLIHQSARQSLGGLLVRQRGDAFSPATLFGVGRYSRNVGSRFRMGALATLKHHNARPGRPGNTNLVGVVDGFARISEPLYARGMVSFSNNSHSGEKGIAGFTEINYTRNSLLLSLKESFSTDGYRPEAGFVQRTNFVLTNPEITFMLQKEWLPGIIRFYTPGIAAQVYHRASDLALQEALVKVSPVSFVFQDRAILSLSVNPTWQVLPAPFEPITGVRIAAGNYRYTWVELAGNTNLSAPYSAAWQATAGGYYNGWLNSFTFTLRAAPLPHVAFSGSYTRNAFTGVGTEDGKRTAHLVAPELRLAINPQVQLSGFYQYNTVSGSRALNVRFSWQYRPLSFFYVVFNDVRSLPSPGAEAAFYQQTGIVKLSYIWQL